MGLHQKYSIGLDIGVASVGWACMTPDFRIPKYNGRYAIGVREFESAETAETRRIQRGTRRRYNRRIRRIQLLQQTLSPLFIDDPGFFIATDEKEKHFWRQSNQFEHNSLSETLKKLGLSPRKYPTIYHLRHAIVKNVDQKFHPRLIYLALHHLVKYRGHFLNKNMSWLDVNNEDPLHEKVYQFFKELDKHYYDNESITEQNMIEVVRIMELTEITNMDKQKEIVKVIGRNFMEPVKLILGLKANLQKLFPNSENVQLYQEDNLSISFNDEKIDEVMDQLTDEERMTIEQGLVIFQEILLQDLLGTARYVSEAKVKSYDQFGADLKILKQIFNDYFGEKAYREMFITSRKNQREYQQTRNQSLLCTFDQFLRIHKTEEKFYKDLTKKLKDLVKRDLSPSELHKINQIIERLDRGQFLQKQRNIENAAIPHQNNVYEAEMILKNQQKFYSEITDEMIERVKKIIQFRIPYYIGPLIKNNHQSEFGWAVRKSDEHVLPWTIDEVIDRSQSAEKFINRMTSYCAYLTEEKVLPKHSLTYEMFEVLNELNGIQIRPKDELPNRKYRLNTEVKTWIIENVFKKYKNVTHRRLQNELKKSPYKEVILDKNGERLNIIDGTQKEDRFATSLSSYIDMKRIFGQVDDRNQQMIEEIIYWISVFEEKDILALKIKEKYSEVTNEQIKSLQQLNYVGWGRLSKRLIDELIVDQVNQYTMLDIMKKETLVFMEVLAIEKYNLRDRIAKMNQDDEKKFTKITYEDVEQLQGSPAIKKGIWQAILIIEELVDIFGEPEHIMIEFAREDGVKGQRSTNRKKQITALQRAISKDEKELKDFLKAHSDYENEKFQSNRFYLYVTQGGKCLYSGEPLDVNRLHEYEVDHILPRSFVDDDSIDNLALVKQRMNQAKGSDKMPLEIISSDNKIKQKMYWKKLYENKLISQTKYFRLLKESFSDQDKESFFARQLVETRQITRHVRDLLEERFEHTEIHPVNANIVTNLREHSGILKIRELNNKHHAVDAAFANLIVQFILKKYGQNFLNFNFKYQEAHKKWRKMLTKYQKHFFLFADIDKHDKFTHYQTGELISGREFLNMINDEIPWQTTKKIGSGEGAFYKETLFSPQVKEAKYKSSKVSKGVYDEMKTDSMYLISYVEKNKQGKETAKSEFVDLYVIEKYQLRKKTKKELAIFLANKIAKGQVIDAVIHAKILKYQLVSYKDHLFSMISAREKHNAKQLVLSKELLQDINEIFNEYRNKNEIKIEKLKTTFANLTETVNKQYKEFINQNARTRISEYVDEIVDIESFMYGLLELFKTTSASAARSSKFGVRYMTKTPPSEVKFIHQSITGLRYRKPKSYRNELWSK